MSGESEAREGAEKRGEYNRKWLVVLDGTEECAKAVSFAAFRVRRTGGTVVLLVVIEPDQFQHWLGVENIMRAEAMEEANALFDVHESRIKACGNIKVERVVREGDRAEQVEALIHEDPDIAILVLAAGTSNEGPGPLVSSIASRSSNAFPIPVAIGPGSLSDEEIEALS
jgi:nucleotide-binding universal stress UspA family protein